MSSLAEKIDAAVSHVTDSPAVKLTATVGAMVLVTGAAVIATAAIVKAIENNDK